MVEQNDHKDLLSGQKVRRTWIWIIVSTFILTLLILSILPYGIEYGIERVLIESGAEKAIVEDVDFNPFTRTLTVHGAKVTRAEHTLENIPKLVARLSWGPLIQKRFYIKQLDIYDASFVIEQTSEGEWRLAGLVPPVPEDTEKKDTSPWNVGIGQLTMTKSTVTLLTPEIKTVVHVRNLRISDLAGWKPEEPAGFDLSGQINDGALSMSLSLAPFSVNPWLKGTVKLEGLSLNPFAPLLPQVTMLGGTLTIDTKIEAERQSNTTIKVVHQGAITLAKTGMQSQTAHIKSENFHWEGKLDLAIKDDMLDFEVQGNINLSGLSIDAQEQGIRLLELQRLALDKVDVKNAKEIGISRILASNLQIGKYSDNKKANGPGSEVPLFTTSSATALDIVIKEHKDIMIQSVELEDVETYFRLDSNGQWHLIEDILAVPQKPEPDQQKESLETSVKIANVQILGNSHIRFEDESVTPPYRTTLNLNKLQVQDIDSTKAEQQSPVTFDGKIGEYSSVLFSGHVQPFARRLTLNLEGTITELDLPSLSSYAAKSLGYNLNSGHLDAAVKLQIVQGQIESTNDLALRNLKASPKDDEKIKQLTTQLPVPVDTALSLLRDKDNTIRLKLPVRGDVTDPKFELGDIINKALGSAIKKAAITYMKLSFQPYGGLMTVVEIAGKTARLRLDPVFFDPGSSLLHDAAVDYLKRVAKIMNDRPQIKISVCGKVVQSDIAVFREQKLLPQEKDEPPLQPVKEGKKVVQSEEHEKISSQELTEEQKHALARERALAVKNYLVREHGIAAGQLFLCKPETDNRENAKPRVELLI